MSKYENVYSKEELTKMVAGMEAISAWFYPQAVKIGHHAFIEFCGLMNEYINMCQASLDQGADFTKSNVHVGGSLPIAPHHARYLAEKFECIFGPTFAANPRMALIFAEAVFPGFTLKAKEQSTTEQPVAECEDY